MAGDVEADDAQMPRPGSERPAAASLPAASLPSAAAFRAAPSKAITLIGMSGVGKTTVANRLRAAGDWFHYSVDYRIGTRYMGEPILDNVKQEAMKVPFLRDLLRSDSIYIASNITFDNLAPLSSYLGKPGAREKGGLAYSEYLRRQRLHRDAEISSLLDVGQFVKKARDIYGYQNFVCDAGGSLVEVVDPWNPADPVLTELSKHTLLVSLAGEPGDVEELCRRFEADPKPMYYDEAFLEAKWREYLDLIGCDADAADPNEFARWGYRELIVRREPRYRAVGALWGVDVRAAHLAAAQSTADILGVIERALAERDAAIPAG